MNYRKWIPQPVRPVCYMDYSRWEKKDLPGTSVIRMISTKQKCKGSKEGFRVNSGASVDAMFKHLFWGGWQRGQCEGNANERDEVPGKTTRFKGTCKVNVA